MARLKPKEFDPTMLLKIQKHQADTIINAEKAGEEIAGRKEDANSWLRNWRFERGIPVDSGVMPPVDEVPTFLRPYLFPKAEASPKDSMKIAHEGDHKPDFQLPDGRDYYQYPNHKEEIPVDPSGNPIPQLQNKSEEVAWVKNVGEPITLEELIEGMKIIDDTETNPLKKRLRQDRMINNNPLAMSPADVPLGDGMIYEAKTQMQKNLKQKYDVMLENGFIDEVEYQKQMKRLFGTKGKK